MVAAVAVVAFGFATCLAAAVFLPAVARGDVVEDEVAVPAGVLVIVVPEPVEVAMEVALVRMLPGVTGRKGEKEKI